MTIEDSVGICEVYGIVACSCGNGPIEVACTEIGVHRCHNFVITSDILEFEQQTIETKEQLIERMRESLKGG